MFPPLEGPNPPIRLPGTQRPVTATQRVPHILRSRSVARSTWMRLALFSATPVVIGNRLPAQTITLSGAGTNWISGTTVFTVSGVTGASLVSQAITGVGAATIVIATGPATGTLTISDGTHSLTIQVADPIAGLPPTRQPAGACRWFPQLRRR